MSVSLDFNIQKPVLIKFSFNFKAYCKFLTHIVIIGCPLMCVVFSASSDINCFKGHLKNYLLNFEQT